MTSWTSPEVWMQIDALAASYERSYGIRPNQLRIGAAVAREIEPGSTHPPHLAWERQAGQPVWFPKPPNQGTWLEQFRRERECRKLGGHFWHPADPMIAWSCCFCGRDTDGTPEDGRRG